MKIQYNDAITLGTEAVDKRPRTKQVEFLDKVSGLLSMSLNFFCIVSKH